MKKLLISLLILSLFSCKSAKVKQTTIVKDSVNVNKEIIITKASASELKFKVCDSLGNVIPINYTSTNGNTKTIIKAIRDTIFIQMQSDSIKTENEQKTQIKTEYKEITKEIPKTPKWVYYLIVYAILITAILVFLLR